MNKPLILITNDDSYRAKGIKALIDSVKDLGEIVVVAPQKPNSGMSGAISAHDPLRFFQKGSSDNITTYVCSGTPVDCVKLALNEILANRTPDILLSGINHGSNSAVSVLYSGTLGAAMEGCLKGISSIGFSLLDHGQDADFSTAKNICNTISREVLEDRLPLGTCLNVNIPTGNKIKGIRAARQTKGYWVNEYKKSSDGANRDIYWLTGNFNNLEETDENTDEYILKENYVSIVPVKVDMTDYAYLEKMKHWNMDY